MQEKRTIYLKYLNIYRKEKKKRKEEEIVPNLEQKVKTSIGYPLIDSISHRLLHDKKESSVLGRPRTISLSTRFLVMSS